VVQWLWDVDGDGRVDYSSDRGEYRMTAPRRPGSYRVTLRVRDNDNNFSAPDSATLHVMNGRPQVDPGRDITVKVGTRVLFRPTVTSHCSTILRYEWDLDDDGTSEYSSRTDGNTSQIYHRAGRYRARLRTRDSFGRETGGLRIITVSGRHEGT
jgi:PKD repeat protein